MTESAQLAIEAPAPLASRVAATLADLLASSGVRAGRTGSVVLAWPNPLLPGQPEAWEAERPEHEDPLAFAFRLLHGPAREGWEAPVDGVRDRVADWARSERLQVASPWPDGATCAIALVHEAHPLDPEPRGLRRALRRGGPDDRLAAYRRAAEAERFVGARSGVRSADLLLPAEQALVHELGFSLATGANVLIASRPGLRRGTAFPTRGFDAAAGRVADWAELPLLGDDPEPGIAALLERGGAAALAPPIARFHGDGGDEAAGAYGALLERLRALGAWLATPEDVVGRLYAP